MRTKKPLIVRIVIWICVFFMVISLIGVYVVYMFSPQQEAGENTDGTLSGSTETMDQSNETLILPEIDAENPENSSAPILMVDDEESDEMNQTFEVKLENGETEVIKQGDLGNDIQINK